MSVFSATVEAAQALSVIQPNVFGHDWSFTADLEKPDTAYTNLGIGLHTDATYYNEPMGLQIFHVLHHAGNGGETMLADGFQAIQQLMETDKEAFEFLCHYQLEHEYIDSSNPGADVKSIGTVISKNPIT